METKIIKIDQDNLDHKLMQEAGDLIAADFPALEVALKCYNKNT